MTVATVGARDALRALRHPPRPDEVAGLIYADTLTTIPLSASPAPPTPRRVALMAVWENEAAEANFRERSAFADLFSGGIHASTDPLRVYGGWAGIPPLAPETIPADPDEPVCVLTYGRVRKLRLIPFLRTSRAAEREAAQSPAMVTGIAMARLPHIVATFSVWRTVKEMQEYAYRGAGHTHALAEVRRDDFHHESMFVRLRPYVLTGVDVPLRSLATR